MRIGIIGAGQIGGSLARQLAKLGHEVTIANSRGPETLAEFAQEIGVTATTVEDSAKDKDMIILAIPTTAMPKMKGLFNHLSPEVAVVDTSNYYPELRDGRIPEIDNGMLDSEWVEKQIGHPVIKAFNNILATSLNASRTKRIALSAAGDNFTAKTRVLTILKELGFDAMDCGNIANSWRQQMGSPAYCKDLTAEELKVALERADRAKLSDYRAKEEIRVKKLMGL